MCSFSLSQPCFQNSPAEHEHVAGAGVLRQWHQLLETQLFTAPVEAVSAVGAPRVVIATRAILHRPQPLGTLWTGDGEGWR